MPTKSALLQIIAQETDTDRKKAGEFTFHGNGKLVRQDRTEHQDRGEDRGEIPGLEEREGCGAGWEVDAGFIDVEN